MNENKCVTIEIIKGKKIQLKFIIPIFEEVTDLKLRIIIKTFLNIEFNRKIYPAIRDHPET